MKIAVIGGGIGGLAVAYNVISEWRKAGLSGEPPQVTVYEKSDRFGGNGDTVWFSLGKNSQGKEIRRWADLGVNDFNATAYVRIVEIMTEIGFVEGQNYRLLEDSTSYYTLDGSIAYTQGGDSTPATEMPAGLAKSVNDFMVQAPGDAQQPKYADYSVRQYIEEVGKDRWDPDLGPRVIYPRVNGMYFTDEVAPTDLPLRAVMHYYVIQEGAGKQEARRMYFVGGASSWIDQLTSHMTDKLGVTLRTKSPVWIRADSKGWELFADKAGRSTLGVVDKVVVATHADDALKLFISGASAGIVDCLSAISYMDGLSIAHTFADVLSPDRNAWKTYNILIHQPPETGLKPYTISYVCNRHQNDSSNPEYNFYGGPEFFVTVNPPVRIPSRYVLKDADTGKPAYANLRHNVLDLECLAAQEKMQELQGENDIYFAGGWTLGAGLHEECWVQGQKIANFIVTGEKTDEHHYNSRPGAVHFAPAYMRKLVTKPVTSGSKSPDVANAV
jgi:uncharacterized protein